MLFKQIRKVFIIICPILLLACEESGDYPLSNSTDIVSKNQLATMVSQINFVTTLPGGQTVTLSPHWQFGEMEHTNYSDIGNTQYTREESQVVIEVSENTGAGFFELSNPENNLTLTVNFDFVYCTTYHQLRVDYPQLNIDPSMDNYGFIAAFSESNDTILDLFEGQVGSEKYLFAAYDLYDQGTFGLYHQKGVSQNDFHGQTQTNGNKVRSEGKLYNSVVNYEFEFDCPN